MPMRYAVNGAEWSVDDSPNGRIVFDNGVITLVAEYNDLYTIGSHLTWQWRHNERDGVSNHGRLDFA